ncbi:MAG: hypothetical protein Q7S52_00930 [bacterium]|nr:hypothetical protein [bacterium]
MKYATTTNVRKNLSRLVDEVRLHNTVIAIGRRKNPDALLVKFPEYYNNALSAELNFQANGRALEWLKDEPDLYTTGDLKKRYA